jgi:lycopene cyclase domain-containing protein
VSWAYLAAVLLATVGIAFLDLRYRLVLFGGRRGRSLLVLGCGVVLFLVWDVLAIDRGFYERGDSPGMTGIELAAELPVEELCFIAFLCYLTLVLHGLVRQLVRQLVRRSAVTAAPAEARR